MPPADTSSAPQEHARHRVPAAGTDRPDFPGLHLVAPLPLDRRVRRIVALFTSDLAQEYSVEELAALVHLSPRHLERLFRSETGWSPKQYLRRHRLLVAAELLVTSFLSVREIASRVGYRVEHRHFGHDFREQYGMLPTAYRRRFQESPGRCD